MSSSYPTSVNDSSDRKFHERTENVLDDYSGTRLPASYNKGYASQNREVHVESFAGTLQTEGFDEF